MKPASSSNGGTLIESTTVRADKCEISKVHQGLRLKAKTGSGDVIYPEIRSQPWAARSSPLVLTKTRASDWILAILYELANQNREIST
jgi:hypothetical protein